MKITRIINERTERLSHLEIDDARITFRNFEGRESEFNRPGDRNFALVIDDLELAQELRDEGWNVKIKPPREEGDDPFCYLNVKVKFNGRGPNCYLIAGGAQRTLSEDTVGVLDKVRIRHCDLDIRPYDWENNRGSGRSAYLQSIRVEQDLDRFARPEEY